MILIWLLLDISKEFTDHVKSLMTFIRVFYLVNNLEKTVLTFILLAPLAFSFILNFNKSSIIKIVKNKNFANIELSYNQLASY